MRKISISSDLGGGAHGHLGLVLSPEEFTLVNDTPYELPAHLGPLTLPCNADVVEVVRQRDQHQEQIRKFWETIDIQKALIQQIVAAINNQYIDKLQNDTANTITWSIPEILQYLYDIFVGVTSHEVAKEEEKIGAFSWNILEPSWIFLMPLMIYKHYEHYEVE